MKKFIVVLLIIILIFFYFIKCKQVITPQVIESTLPENGIVITPDPVMETAEAEDAIIEIKNIK